MDCSEEIPIEEPRVEDQQLGFQEGMYAMQTDTEEVPLQEPRGANRPFENPPASPQVPNHDRYHGRIGMDREANSIEVTMRESRGQICQAAWENPDSDIGLCGWLLVGFSLLLMLVTLPISIWMCIKIVKEYERAIIFRLGRILRGGARGPGLFLILPCTDSFINVDMRTITFDIPPQEVLTKDSVTVSVDGVVFYRVQNATQAVANITNADSATRLLAQTTLRNVLGTKNLEEILSDREEIARSMQATLDDVTDEWGIKVERVEIKDVQLPQQLQRAMAAEAEASREARAKVIAAEGEMNASQALKEASLVISESPSGLQLRYLQTLKTIAAEKNSTIILPLPLEMMQSFMKH